ncbi:MAG: hypothetical protein JKY46_10055 [Robiginitomaculum sp.]|nr:hypothetical protein [Robiginitomaculum sp.]
MARREKKLNLTTKEKHQLAKTISKRLIGEYSVISRSWAMYKAGNGWKEEDRKKLRNKLKDTIESHGYVTALDAFAGKTALGVYTMIDKGVDAYSLNKLKSCLNCCEVRKMFAKDAESWPPIPDIEDETYRQERKDRSNELVLQKIENLISGISKFLKNDIAKQLKKTRNGVLAHNLDISPDQIEYVQIDDAFKKIGELVAAAELVTEGTFWNIDNEFKKHLEGANVFWDTFERGLDKTSK